MKRFQFLHKRDDLAVVESMVMRSGEGENDEYVKQDME
jgi:hypothetical protein